MQTLKQILNDVLSQSTFLERSTFIGSTDPDDKQMVAIANRVVEEIRDFYNWSPLRSQFTILMEEGKTLYSLPSDFRAYVPNSGWQDEGSRPIELPVPDGRWYMYKNSAFSDGGTYRCRLVGNNMEVFEPDAGQRIVFDYVSDYAILSTTGVPRSRWMEDEDTFRLDDQLLTLGIQAHWGEAKVLPQAAKWMANYRAKTNEAIGRDAGGRTLGGYRKGSGSGESPYTPLWKT